MGENPVVGSMHGQLQREGLRKLDWLVVRDFSLIETAEFWQDDPTAIATEVFFFPAATHTEKDGTYTNTQRLLQFHHKAVEPPGDCRSELWFMFHLGRKLRVAVSRLDRSEGRAAARAHVGLPDRRRARGARTSRRSSRRSTASPSPTARRSTASPTSRRRLDRVRLLDLLRLQQGRRQPGGAAQARARTDVGRARVGMGVAGEPPAHVQPRVGRPRRQAVVGAQGVRVVGRRAGASGPATTCPTSSSTARRRTGRADDAAGIDTIAGDAPFIMQADGRGWIYAPTGLLDGPLPTHYEPQESPFDNPLYRQQRNPARMEWRRPDNPYHRPFGDPDHPYVVTTYRLTEHHTAGGMSRWLPWLSELQPELFCEVSPELAAERGLRNGDWATISTARAEIEARVLVTERACSRCGCASGRSTRSVCRTTGRAAGWSTGDTVNELIAFVADPNVSIQESKALTADIRPGRRIRAMTVGFFTDTTVCIGCKACEVACKQWNQLPDDGLAVHRHVVRQHRASRRVDVAARRVRRTTRRSRTRSSRG